MKINTSSSLKMITLVAAMTFCCGCQWFDSLKKRFFKKETVVITPTNEEDTSPVVVYINGEPVLRKNDVNNQITQLVQSQLQGAGNADSIAPIFKKMILNQIVDREAVIAWERKNDIESSSEFKKVFEDHIKMLKSHLIFQLFQKHIIDGIEVNDSEVRAEYEKNKSRYVKSQGGALALGVKFDSQEKADEFITKMKNKENDFEKYAKEEIAGTFASFGRVSEETVNRDIPATIKEAVATFKGSVPALILVKDGDALWTVCISDIQEPQYYAFDEIKGYLENMLKSQKVSEAYSKKLSEVKKSLSIEIKEDLLGLTQKDLEEQAPAQVAENEMENDQAVTPA